jgi:transcriptional regulator with XRE-family HTH domain
MLQMLLDLFRFINNNIPESLNLMCGYSHMTAAEQLGTQLRAARGQLSLRALSDQVAISASTLGEYERGVKVPEADKLARIAEALNCFTFRIDNFYFTVSRAVVVPEPLAASAQLPLDFSGEYSYAKASVKIRPGRISVVFDGARTSSPRVHLAVSSN